MNTEYIIKQLNICGKKEYANKWVVRSWTRKEKNIYFPSLQKCFIYYNMVKSIFCDLTFLEVFFCIEKTEFIF